MSISPVSGMVYANQVAPAASSKQMDFQTRFEAQNLAAANYLNEKEKEITEVRPTEETYKIDPEKEHERKRSDEEAGATEEQVLLKENEEEDEEEENLAPPRLLDITI